MMMNSSFLLFFGFSAGAAVAVAAAADMVILQKAPAGRRASHAGNVWGLKNYWAGARVPVFGKGREKQFNREAKLATKEERSVSPPAKGSAFGRSFFFSLPLTTSGAANGFHLDGELVFLVPDALLVLRKHELSPAISARQQFVLVSEDGAVRMMRRVLRPIGHDGVLGHSPHHPRVVLAGGVLRPVGW